MSFILMLVNPRRIDVLIKLDNIIAPVNINSNDFICLKVSLQEVPIIIGKIIKGNLMRISLYAYFMSSVEISQSTCTRKTPIKIKILFLSFKIAILFLKSPSTIQLPINMSCDTLTKKTERGIPIDSKASPMK